MIRRGALPVAAAVCCVVVGVTTAQASTGRALCGVERWTVKTLQDRPRLLPARSVKISYLVARHRPANISARLPFERRVFIVTAAVVLVRPEEDGDLHLVLRSGRWHMIAEAPSPSCDARASPVYRHKMASARNAVRVCTRARVTGIAFFDYDHGQTGVAPNAIELHPIIGFRCLSP